LGKQDSYIVTIPGEDGLNTSTSSGTRDSHQILKGGTMRSLMRPLAAALLTAAIFGSLAAPALAGEVTGNGKSLKNEDGTLNGNSICAFSGQNDTYTGDPEVPDEDGFTRTQNWGQVSKEGKEFLTSIGLHPGDSCKPGFEE
jgi:hypothetical protein